MEYINFDAEVRPGVEGYLISVRSAVGETQAPVLAAFPFTAAALETHLLKLENAILKSVGRRRKARSAEEESVQTLGQALFEFLLAGDALSLYRECQREAEHTGQGVRLRLRLGEAPELAGLPWEFLYDPRRKDYLCLDPYTPVLRYLELARTAAPLVVRPPLRILGMVASPSDLDPLDVEQEKRRVETALASLQAEGLVELTWLAGEGWEDLQKAMRGGPWHIFHFIGHGQFDRVRDEGMLVFADRRGRARPFSATQLNRLLASQRYNLRLVVINACEGARGGQEDITSSVAATLAQGGIPAVLAMQYEITDSGAVAFAESFYNALADGVPIDWAVADARNAVNYRDESSLEWGIPVLHMRTTDGRLFDVQADRREISSQKPSRDDGAAEEESSSAQPSLTEIPKPKPPIATQSRTSAPQAQPTPTPARPDGPVAFDWVTVPAGEFLMGSDKRKDAAAADRESPQHTVHLPAFRIARVPVTNAQYKEFVDATGQQTPEHWKSGQIPKGKEDHPVVTVSWQDAVEFCKWAQVRLPTEAEWEKAARGGDGRLFPWGKEEPDEKRCNSAMKVGDTTPVGRYPDGVSPYGCLDMAGNVWEWTGSLFEKYPYDARDGREDPTGSGRRVLRGGSFNHARGHVRCAYRRSNYPDARDEDIGFRVVSPGL